MINEDLCDSESVIHVNLQTNGFQYTNNFVRAKLITAKGKKQVVLVKKITQNLQIRNDREKNFTEL